MDKKSPRKNYIYLDINNVQNKKTLFKPNNYKLIAFKAVLAD